MTGPHALAIVLAAALAVGVAAAPACQSTLVWPAVPLSCPRMRVCRSLSPSSIFAVALPAHHRAFPTCLPHPHVLPGCGSCVCVGPDL